MVNEKRLFPFGEKVTLDDLPCGTLFAFGDDCIAVKSEYRCSNGLIEAFIIDSGEQFWGGVHTAKEQNALMVQPLEIVEVVHGRWINNYINRYGHPCHCCSVCGFKASYQDKNYCPGCGAKMDGGNEDG